MNPPLQHVNEGFQMPMPIGKNGNRGWERDIPFVYCLNVLVGLFRIDLLGCCSYVINFKKQLDPEIDLHYASLL